MPLGAPLATHPEAPIVQGVVGILFALFLAGATWQVLKLRAARKSVADDREPVAAPIP